MVKEIEKVRNKLYKTIIKNGLDSNETIEISNKFSSLILEYYNEFSEEIYVLNSKNKQTHDDFYERYFIAKDKLKKLYLKNKKFPTVEEWNKFAKKYNYLNNISIEYISQYCWHDLRSLIINSCKEKS